MGLSEKSILLYIARTIAFLWAAFWLFVGITSGIGEGLKLAGLIMHVIFPGVLFLSLALFAWRWPVHGAIVLILCGIAVLILYPVQMGRGFPLSTVLFVLSTMGAPPLIAGLLMLIHARKHKPTFRFKAED
jgi:hypothetical protein